MNWRLNFTKINIFSTTQFRNRILKIASMVKLLTFTIFVLNFIKICQVVSAELCDIALSNKPSGEAFNF